jgi:hypothetical protein
MTIIILATGVWLSAGALIINANSNLMSKIIFKVVPFFLGLANLFVGAKMIGWI